VTRRSTSRERAVLAVRPSMLNVGPTHLAASAVRVHGVSRRVPRTRGWQATTSAVLTNHANRQLAVRVRGSRASPPHSVMPVSCSANSPAGYRPVRRRLLLERARLRAPIPSLPSCFDGANPAQACDAVLVRLDTRNGRQRDRASTSAAHRVVSRLDDATRTYRIECASTATSQRVRLSLPAAAPRTGEVVMSAASAILAVRTGPH